MKAEGQGEGVSGVLDQDRSGVRNKEPEMPIPAHYADQAWDGFKARLSRYSKELIAGYFASAALNQKIGDLDRVAALLYLLDLAGGTRYETESQKLQLLANQAILTNADAIRTFVQSLNLPIPDQVAIATESVPNSPSPKMSFERVLDGIVTVETDTAKGSGFFLTPACLIITNEHVINGAETIILRTSARKLFVAQVLAVDTDRDLALLRSNAQSCTPLSLEDTAKISVGQDIFAVGNPLEFSGTVTKGIVSSIRTTSNGIRLIQVDAAINPGNSGGPLINSSGMVLGVNTFKRRGSEGLNFAIASDEIKNAFGRFLR